MIILSDFKAVFIAVPKTGTRSIFEVLKGLGGNQHGHHERVVPKAVTTYFTFLTKRDPYERVCSAFWSTCMNAGDPYRYKQHMKETTVLEYLRSIKQRGHMACSNVSRYQLWWHTKARVDHILRFEHLEEDFLDLSFLPAGTTLPFRNSTRPHRPPAKEMLCDEAVALVNELYAPDFDYLGYERIEV